MTTSMSADAERKIWGVIAASSAGTVIEWYDFYIFGSLSAVLSGVFYPETNDTISLLKWLATFAVGFAVRPLGAIVFAGFSQGASMAYRAAALGERSAASVISLGGDIPPELSTEALARIPHALVGRGADDRFYGRETNTADLRRLEAASVHVTAIALAGGHEWGEPFSRAASDWIQTLS